MSQTSEIARASVLKKPQTYTTISVIHRIDLGPEIHRIDLGLLIEHTWLLASRMLSLYHLMAGGG